LSYDTEAIDMKHGANFVTQQLAQNLPTTITTAGAYIRVGDAYLFALGPNPTNTALAVFRIGGHVEAGESPWACAAREALEEAAVVIAPIAPPATNWLDRDEPAQRLQSIDLPRQLLHPVAPFLIVTAQSETGIRSSVMYLAQTTDMPIPSSEIKGLILVKQHELSQIVQLPVTLRQFVEQGGRVLLRSSVDTNLVLVPLLQARMLARIISDW
jgi:8-oxo-dGTP pyrophosphatase MutT (NUDIX family)